MAAFCYQRQALRWLAIPLAGAHRRHHERLFDSRVDFEKQSTELGWWWLSFGVASAAERAHGLKINPGGSVRGTKLIGDGIPAPQFRNKLLSREQLSAAGLIE